VGWGESAPCGGVDASDGESASESSGELEPAEVSSRKVRIQSGDIVCGVGSKKVQKTGTLSSIVIFTEIGVSEAKLGVQQ
jgi:hypothetical protein